MIDAKKIQEISIQISRTQLVVAVSLGEPLIMPWVHIPSANLSKSLVHRAQWN